MSGIAVIFERTNTPVSTGVLVRVMDRLKHRGPHGSDVVHAGQAALGHCHFWTTPEEVGERQPLCLPGLSHTIVFDGRLDNREDLAADLGIPTSDLGRFSDAAIVLQFYARWGEDCVSHFIGEFAFAILDEQQGRIFCARDHLGDRTLFYALEGTRFVVASEPWAVAAAINSAPRSNEYATAAFFAFEVPADGQTLLEGIYELLPAHIMVVDATRERRWRYWQPDLSHKIRGLSDQEYAEQFRSLLEKSVRCRMRSSSPVGVLMSGGLDSTSVACLAARMTPGTPLTTISFVFDELKSCDERPYINAVKEKYLLNSIQIPCDDAWPFWNWKEWPPYPNEPILNPYRLLKERAYQRAREDGIQVMFTGDFGDHLYDAGMNWLADLLADGQLRLAARELFLFFQYVGWRQTLSAGFIWRVIRRLLDSIPLGKHLHRGRKPPPWLTPYSIRVLADARTRREPAHDRCPNLLGLLAARSSSSVIIYSSHYGLEFRHPYRDRRLVEYVLALPAYQLFLHGRYKHILRNAMRGILPDAIRSRNQPTSLMQLFFRGLEQEGRTLRSCLESPDCVWGRFVRSDWVLKQWNTEFHPQEDGPNTLIPWLCCSFEKWRESVFNI